MAMLASAVSVAALVLACAGLRGCWRTRCHGNAARIGLRWPLGAAQSSVVWLVLRECVAIAAIGSIVGIGASLALGRFAQTLLYQVRATDLWSIAIAGAIMLAVAACAGLVPARRAASVDPVVALRCD